jgi:RNA recognition motif-containing protein
MNSSSSLSLAALPPSLVPMLKEAECRITGQVVQTSAFVKNVPTSFTDDLIEPVLRSCGSLRRWKRPIGPNGLPKSFGFLEYTSVDGLWRAVRLLNGLPLGAHEYLAITVDADTEACVEAFSRNVWDALASAEQRTQYERVDRVVLRDLLELCRAKHLHLAIDFVERRLCSPPLSFLKPPPPLNNEDDRQVREDRTRTVSLGDVLKPRAKVIDWTGFEEKERRWLGKEQRHDDEHQQQARHSALGESWRQHKLQACKHFLLHSIPFPSS